MPSIRVYIASSIDGFIAGPDDDLSWLPGADGGEAGADGAGDEGAGAEEQAESGALTYEAFVQDIGALLMGRRTYDVLRGFDVEWPYGGRPVLVATHRPLDPSPPPTVRAVSGSIEELVRAAQSAAGSGDVYLDGGNLIRRAAAAGLIDDLTLTIAPIALGAGIPLFAGLEQPFPMEIVSHHRFAHGMLQIRARPRKTEPSPI